MGSGYRIDCQYLVCHLILVVVLQHYLVVSIQVDLLAAYLVAFLLSTYLVAHHLSAYLAAFHLLVVHLVQDALKAALLSLEDLPFLLLGDHLHVYPPLPASLKHFLVLHHQQCLQKYLDLSKVP